MLSIIQVIFLCRVENKMGFTSSTVNPVLYSFLYDHIYVLNFLFLFFFQVTIVVLVIVLAVMPLVLL